MLRTAMSLARPWQRQDKRGSCLVMYDRLTEGFDTADLKDAKALLDELA